jgi:hypothetical protein
MCQTTAGGVALKQRQRGEDRRLAAAAGNDDLCARPQCLLDRLAPITSTMWVAASISASLSGAEGGKRDPNNGRRRGRPGSCQRHHTILV